MKKKNQNIGKYRHGGLPDPEIPADDAWAQMDRILGPIDARGKGQQLFEKIFKYKWAFLFICSLTVSSTIILMNTFYFPKLEKKSILKSKGSTNRSASAREKNAEKINDFLYPAEIFQSNKGSKKIGEINSSLQEQNRIIGIHPGKVHNELQDVTTKQFGKSDRQEERVSKVYIAAKASRPKLKISQNTSASTDRTEPEKFRGNEKLEKIYGLPNHKKEREFFIVKDRNKLSEELYAGQVSSIADKNFHNVISIPAVSFLMPISKLGKLQHSIPSNMIVEIPHYKVNAQKRKRIRSVQFGPEWNLNSSLRNTDYLFAGKDSVSRPFLSLIPGIFISKSWQRHTVSFTFSPYQSHFGNNKIVSYTADSTLVNDSLNTYSRFYNNSRLIKGSGLNISMNYHYQATKIFALTAGLSFSFFANALVRKEIESNTGAIIPGALLNLNKSGGLTAIINPSLIAFKGGFMITPGRFQVGLNVIVPVTHISHELFMPVNGQFFIRVNCF